MDLLDLVDGKPQWKPACRPYPLHILEQRVDEKGVSIHVGKRWRRSRWFEKQCACGGDLVYVGWVLQGWCYRWKCVVCGCESRTMFAGYVPITPTSPRGTSGWLRERRRKAGY